MQDYYFIYKDSINNWRFCTNPVFIASHQHCRAILKKEVEDILGYAFIGDLIYDLNQNLLTPKQLDILLKVDITKA